MKIFDIEQTFPKLQRWHVHMVCLTNNYIQIPTIECSSLSLYNDFQTSLQAFFLTVMDILVLFHYRCKGGLGSCSRSEEAPTQYSISG